MAKTQFKRRKKLINPVLQLRMAGAFVALSALSLLLQFLLFANNLSRVASELPQDGPILMEQASSLLAQTLMVSFLLLLPVTLLVGILVTFRVAGPLYRFTQFLGAVERGEHPGECTIRKGDYLHDFCDVLNRVTAPMRAASATTPGGPRGPRLLRDDEESAA